VTDLLKVSVIIVCIRFQVIIFSVIAHCLNPIADLAIGPPYLIQPII